MQILKVGSFLLIAILIFISLPEVIHSNSGQSEVIGSVRNGGLENAYLLPYKGKNYQYFSLSSYYLANNAYTHHQVYQTVLDAYDVCASTLPNVRFGLMECSDKKGGDMLIHRTHENGMSVDFMVPKLRNGKPNHWLDYLGYVHYLLEFDDQGRSKAFSGIEIDFESIAQHILAIDEAAKQNGLDIRKVILKVELLDDLFNSPSGKLLQQRDIFFVPRLQHMVNVVHDDHYHIDFKIITAK